MMKTNMLTSIRKQLQVLRSVILLITIDMVHDLTGLEGPTELLLHYHLCTIDILSIHTKENIAIADGEWFPFPIFTKTFL